tara:strand:- start:87 stop:308 length:222 start_codon:yes stop_codon:yes gene_type:complete
MMEFLNLNGYGIFVWPAFIFTLTSCSILYIKTKNELKEQEKMFLKEFKYIYPVKTKPIRIKRITKEALTENSI